LKILYNTAFVAEENSSSGSDFIKKDEEKSDSESEDSMLVAKEGHGDVNVIEPDVIFSSPAMIVETEVAKGALFYKTARTTCHWDVRRS